MLALFLRGFAITGCHAQPCPAPASGTSEQTPAPENEPLNTSGALGLSDMQALSLYENADYGFKMSYPEGWIMQEPEANSMGMVVGFLAPGDDVDNAMDYVTVQTESLPAEQKGTLEQYTQSALQNLRSSYPDLKVLAQGDMTFSGQPGQVVVYAITSGQTPFQVMQAFTIKDSRAYIITFNALADRYSEFEDAAKNMINSFEFI